MNTIEDFTREINFILERGIETSFHVHDDDFGLKIDALLQLILKYGEYKVFISIQDKRNYELLSSEFWWELRTFSKRNGGILKFLFCKENIIEIETFDPNYHFGADFLERRYLIRTEVRAHVNPKKCSILVVDRKHYILWTEDGFVCGLNKPLVASRMQDYNSVKNTNQVEEKYFEDLAI